MTRIITLSPDPDQVLSTIAALQQFPGLDVILRAYHEDEIVVGRVLAVHDGLNKISLEIRVED